MRCAGGPLGGLPLRLLRVQNLVGAPGQGTADLAMPCNLARDTTETSRPELRRRKESNAETVHTDGYAQEAAAAIADALTEALPQATGVGWGASRMDTMWR